MQDTPATTRIKPSGNPGSGYTHEEVMKEAARCMHCECLEPVNCKLRILSDMYKASQRKYNYEERGPVQRDIQHELVIYESGKCIKCGICVRLTAKQGEKLGLTYIGRGFDVKISVPFEKDLEAGLTRTAMQVAEACPTGALAARKKS